MRHAIDHCDIDGLPLSRSPSLHGRREQSDHEIQRAATEIGDKIERRRRRRSVGVAETMKRTS